MVPSVRATAVLVEGGRLLLLRQPVSEASSREWSLPGGKVEFGETVGACLVREMKEETGLDVEVGRLLYVCDRIENGHHVVHLTFLVTRRGGELDVERRPEPGTRPIVGGRLVPFDRLGTLGFSDRFRELLAAGFPGAGSYMGPVANIGL